MYRIPDNLDLSPVVGESTTQVRVGQFDVQLEFGPVTFAIQSPINLFRGEQPVARWEPGRWLDPGFYDIMNSEVRRCVAVSDRRIVLDFDNGISMHLEDDSDQYECMQIHIKGHPSPWII